MYEKVEAIVISNLKYSDNSLIVKCFTKTLGTRSYLQQGILSAKKNSQTIALFQPFTLLELVATHKSNGSLGHIKEAKVTTPYHTLHTDIYKSTVSLFLSEVCAYICTSEAPDIELFNYLEEKLIYLDRNNFSANFHLKFLLDLSKYLGFYPDDSDSYLPFFSLEEGHFTTTENNTAVISGNALSLFKTLLETDYPTLNQIRTNKNERNALLYLLLKYYEWHFPNFKKIKSLEVLQVLF